MHAVRDRGDRDVSCRALGPDVVPHRARDLAMLGADTVALIGQPHRECREVKAIPARGVMPDGANLVALDAELWPIVREVTIDQEGRENIVTGGHRSMAGENGAGRDPIHGRFECLPLANMLTNAFEQVKRGMTFIRVPVRRLNAERAQRPDAADAENDLLAQPVLEIAAVK